MDTTTQANGQPTNGKAHTSHHTTIPAPLSEAPTQYDKILSLVRDAVEHEVRLKATLKELESAMGSLAQAELPTVLMAFIKSDRAPQPLITVPRASEKGPGLAKVETTFYLEDAWKGKVVSLMTDGRERKTSAIIKALKATKHKSAIYGALTTLVADGALVKTAYAHYRIRT
jgi:hypothetical protein